MGGSVPLALTWFADIRRLSVCEILLCHAFVCLKRFRIYLDKQELANYIS